MSLYYKQSLFLLCISTFFQIIKCHPRNLSRRMLSSDTDDYLPTYMVYFLEAVEKIPDRFWQCGGAIVSKNYILTSAACVQDMNFIVAVYGTKKFDIAYLDNEKCTKKIVEFCVPKTYEFGYDDFAKWAALDIAVAKVESPFNLGTKDQGCGDPSLLESIAINFYEEFQTTGVSVIAMGWGSMKSYRKEDDKSNNNSPTILTSSLKIMDKAKCVEEYKKAKNIGTAFPTIIEKFMICVDDAEGRVLIDGTVKYGDTKLLPELDGCIKKANLKLRTECFEEVLSRLTLQEPDLFDMRRQMREDAAKRRGICQNDHGGPLISYVGSTPYVLGVASTFIQDKDLQCMGPYAFTSTYCTSGFLRCVLGDDTTFMMREMDKMLHFNLHPKMKPIKIKSSFWPSYRNRTQNRKTTTTRKPRHQNVTDEDYDILKYLNLLRADPDLDEFCSRPDKVRGFKIIKRRISWINHPLGPADNER